MILITGSTGHLGNVLVRTLYSQGEIIGITTQTGLKPDCLSDLDIKVFKCNIKNSLEVEAAVRQSDVVFHLAAKINLSSYYCKDTYETNVMGTQNIIDACLKYDVSKLVYCSTVEVLQSKNNAIITEEDFDEKSNYKTIYTCSKQEATQQVFEACKKGLHAVVCYPSAVIGPYDYRGSEAGKMIKSYIHNKMPVYLEGSFNFVDVRDVVDGMIAAYKLGKTGESYILAGEQCNIDEFLNKLKLAEPGITKPKIKIPIGVALFFAHINETFHGLIKKNASFTSFAIKVLQNNHRFSSQKAIDKLKYNPRPLENSIQDTVTWIKNKDHLV